MSFGKGCGGCFKGGGCGGFPGSFGKGCGHAGKGGFEDEDRSRDWYCAKCQERNFAKRGDCFKCQALRPADGGLQPPKLPQSGTTLNGMVKSYNRKGFGFLMVLGMEHCQDIYYTRENLSPRLQTRDIPGQHVTFEIHRYPDGKMTALNIRPIGEDRDPVMPGKGKFPMGKGCFGAGFQKGGFGGGGGGYGGGSSFQAAPAASAASRDEEDRSRDWNCAKCGERNFVKRFECFKCKEPRSSAFSEGGPVRDTPVAPRRTLSPHAGARAIREALAAGRGRSSSSGGSGGRKRKRSSSGESKSSEASSSSSEKKKKKKKKGKKKRRSKSSSDKSSQSVESSSGSSCRVEGSSKGGEAASGSSFKSGATSNPEVEKAKAEALEHLMKLRSIEPKETRMSEFRALLRKWHPDKNPDRQEVATAVFQFLQKGKQILEGAS